MIRVKQKFVMPELHGISIVIDVMPGEIYSCACERGWWIRNKAVELIERAKNAKKTQITQSFVFEAIDLAVRYGQFWSNYKKFNSKYPLEIMTEIIKTKDVQSLKQGNYYAN